MLSAAFFSRSCRSCSCAKRFSFRAPDSKINVFLSDFAMASGLTLDGAATVAGGAAFEVDGATFTVVAVFVKSGAAVVDV